MASAASRPPSKLYDLDITVVSAKHLKNVNWKNGDLKPYVIVWVDPDSRQSTKPDDSGSTRPVWNDRFVLPLTQPPRDSVLSLEIFHSKPSETPKPLVGTLRFEIRDLLVEPDNHTARNLELRRPSGRPHGKIRLKLALIERPVENYQTAPPPPPIYYYSSAPALPPPSFHNYRGYTSSYSSFPPPPSYTAAAAAPLTSSPPPPQPPQPYPHSGYYAAYYSPPPVPPPRPFFERQPTYGVPGPSAPADYTPYDYQKRSVGKSGTGMGAGLAVGAVTGAMGGLELEGVKYEEEKVAERAESDSASNARDDRYSYYRNDY